MVTINYSGKIKTKEERYLFIQTIFYLVCNKIIENYRQIIKEDIIEKDKLGERTKFKNFYLGRFDGKIILVEVFKLLNPYGVSPLLVLYNAIDKNWNKINGRRDFELTREIYFYKSLQFIRSKLNYTKEEKEQVDIFFRPFNKGLINYYQSKWNKAPLPLYIQLYNEDEVNKVLYFLKNIKLVFGINPFMLDLVLKSANSNE